MTPERARAWQALGLGPIWLDRPDGAARPRSSPQGDAAGAPAGPMAAALEPAAAAGVPTDAPHAASADAYHAAAADTPAAVAAIAVGTVATTSRPVEGLPARPPDVESATWEELRGAVSQCTACGLCKTRRQTVFGVGPQQARCMIIGEAPGAEEDARGEPFVGQAGRLLDRMLAAIDLTREGDVFITNVLKCRPPENRNPAPAEVAACAGYLGRQIALVQPTILLLLGRFAIQSVLGTDASVGSLRGRVHRYRSGTLDLPVVVSYHPAYLLRNLPEKRKSWEDLLLAADTLATS